MGSLRVAWCADPAEFSYMKRLLVQSARSRGHLVTVIHGWEDVPPDQRFDIGVLRSRDAPVDPECCEVAVGLESRGLRFLNSMRARGASKDKLEAARLFEHAGIAQPQWLRDGAGEFPGPVIAKPRFGGRGEGIRTFASVECALDAGVEPAETLVQRYHADRVLWRVIATPERCLRAYRKVTLPDRVRRVSARRTELRRRDGVKLEYRRGNPHALARDFLTAQGELRLPLRPPAAVAHMAMQMVRSLGGDLMGADVIVVEGRPLALELNTNFAVQIHDPWLISQITVELERVAKRRSSPSGDPVPVWAH